MSLYGHCPGGQFLPGLIFFIQELFYPSVMGGSFLVPCLLEIYAATMGQTPDMVATDIFHERVLDTLK